MTSGPACHLASARRKATAEMKLRWDEATALPAVLRASRSDGGGNRDGRARALGEPGGGGRWARGDRRQRLAAAVDLRREAQEGRARRRETGPRRARKHVRLLASVQHRPREQQRVLNPIRSRHALVGPYAADQRRARHGEGLWQPPSEVRRGRLLHARLRSCRGARPQPASHVREHRYAHAADFARSRTRRAAGNRNLPAHAAAHAGPGRGNLTASAYLLTLGDSTVVGSPRSVGNGHQQARQQHHNPVVGDGSWWASKDERPDRSGALVAMHVVAAVVAGVPGSVVVGDA
jgi:hypothetical protein